MTEQDSAAPQSPEAEVGSGAGLHLKGAISRAHWALVWERVWGPFASVLTVAGLFLAASWSGLWSALPPVGRVAGLVLFGALLVLALVPLFRISLPRRSDAVRRLDQRSGIPHRPATAALDAQVGAPTDPVSAALWRAHLSRADATARGLRAGVPSPRIALRDRLAVRALVLVLAVAAFFAAGPDRYRRVVAAFDWTGAVAPANYRIDAWVTPPPYTGKAPVILPGLRTGEAVQTTQALVVPVGSVLVVRATGTSALDLVAGGGLSDLAAEANAARVPAGTEERRFTIRENGALTLRGIARGDVTWSFTAIPDKHPVIALSKDPEPQGRGTLLLAYKVEDDYGVVSAEAAFARKAEPAGGKKARPLYGAPGFPLVMPQARTRAGNAQTLKDLTEHPWAGADVTLTLKAKDEAGNEGESAPHDMKLPERPFTKPLARALVEQRRLLALDADSRGVVGRALDALTIAPQRFTPETSIYLGLRSIYWQLVRARSDDDLRDVTTRLWAMAVAIEDGAVSDAEQALRAAQEALRQALERGASDEEIKRLTDELRAALDRFMQALAEEMRKNPQASRPMDRNARVLRPEDLKSMLDRFENLARSGAKDAARRLLEELQQMLDNLQMARPGEQDGGEGDDAMSSLDQLGDMIRKQQQLRDRTFQQGQDNRRDRSRSQRGQRGQQGQQGQQGRQGQQGQGQQGQDGQGDQFGDLQGNQKALRDELRRLMEELRKRGMGQDGQPGGGELGRAEDAMKDAEGALGEGNSEGAVDSQGRALEAMRRGAQSLAQSMQQQQNGPGPNGQPGRVGPARANQNTDPLGRPLRGREYGDDFTVKVPGEIDAQRARRILEELRRRFADPLRPQLELEYIERLLKDF